MCEAGGETGRSLRVMRNSTAPGLMCLSRGLASVVLGVTALLLPEPTLELLLRLIGGYVIVASLLAVAGGARLYDTRGVSRAWLVLGAVDLTLGVGVFVWPGASALALLWPVGVSAWSLLSGIAQLVAADRLGDQGWSRLLLRANGAFAFIFGIVLAVVALPGTQPVVLLVGVYAVVAGALMLAVAKTTLDSSVP